MRQAHVAVVEVWRNRVIGADSADPGREARFSNRWPIMTGGGIMADRRLPDAAGSLHEGARRRRDHRDQPRLAKLSGGVLRDDWCGAVAGSADVRGVRRVRDAGPVRSFWPWSRSGVAWRGARAAVGEPGGLIVAFLLAVHPQFAVVATAASPDTLVILAGACVLVAGHGGAESPRMDEASGSAVGRGRHRCGRGQDGHSRCWWLHWSSRPSLPYTRSNGGHEPWPPWPGRD